MKVVQGKKWQGGEKRVADGEAKEAEEAEEAQGEEEMEEMSLRSERPTVGRLPSSLQ